ncbi:hypothetical protein pb186bvf_010206 [Paramecium bursaria]
MDKLYTFNPFKNSFQLPIRQLMRMDGIKPLATYPANSHIYCKSYVQYYKMLIGIIVINNIHIYCQN